MDSWATLSVEVLAKLKTFDILCASKSSRATYRTQNYLKLVWRIRWQETRSDDSTRTFLNLTILKTLLQDLPIISAPIFFSLLFSCSPSRSSCPTPSAILKYFSPSFLPYFKSSFVRFIFFSTIAPCLPWSCCQNCLISLSWSRRQSS